MHRASLFAVSLCFSASIGYRVPVSGHDLVDEAGCAKRTLEISSAADEFEYDRITQTTRRRRLTLVVVLYLRVVEVQVRVDTARKPRMASSSDLVPLRKTVEALKGIRKEIRPFLQVIENADRGNGEASGAGGGIDQHTLAEARTAVALAMGTLRHMGARLGAKAGGIGSGRKNDPLRMELDRMRKVLVTLRKIDNKRVGTTGSTNQDEATGSAKVEKQKSEKRKKKTDERKEAGSVLDISAVKRMVEPTLRGERMEGNNGNCAGKQEQEGKRKCNTSNDEQRKEQKRRRA